MKLPELNILGNFISFISLNEIPYPGHIVWTHPYPSVGWSGGLRPGVYPRYMKWARAARGVIMSFRIHCGCYKCVLDVENGLRSHAPVLPPPPSYGAASFDDLSPAPSAPAPSPDGPQGLRSASLKPGAR